jgi:hypothetical protein
MFVRCQATRSGYESAPYQVGRTDGKFELRDYPTLTVVETPMARGGNEADGSFNRLFRFITGGNEAKQKIAMTDFSCAEVLRTPLAHSRSTCPGPLSPQADQAGLSFLQRKFERPKFVL